jgi:5-methylcytosine-specific restriction endonuclease McrA
LAEPDLATHWASVHERLLSLGQQRAAHERDVCRWLLAARRLGVHARAGYASLREYAERVIGLNGRQTEERLRVGRALGELPLLDAALASGELAWSAVREITRVATADTQAAWLAWAKPRRVHQIEKVVAARKLGDGPADRADPSQVKHRLVFEVRAETMALFRDLQATVQADLGGGVDHDAVLYEIARRALGGPTDEGRASYQVAVTRCDACGLASIDAGGASHVVDEVVAEMAACDAQELGELRQATNRPHAGAAERATQTIPPATRRIVMRRDHMRCVVPGCTNHRFLDVHHLDLRSEGGSHDPDNLAVLCGAHHRAVHAGALRIEGSRAVGLLVRHPDGTAYGGPVKLPAVDVVRQVVRMLEHMGFKPTRARALVDAALSAVGSDDAAILLQAALRAS